MSQERIVVRVSAESNSVIDQVAKQRECTAGEAADYLVHVAKGRLNALRRDNKRRAEGKPATMRKVEVKVLKPKAKK